MGQCFNAVNPDSKVLIRPRAFDNFNKLMETAWLGETGANNYINAVMMLLANEWKGQSLSFSGDYADDKLYGAFPDVSNSYSKYNIESLPNGLDIIFNHKKNCYLSLTECYAYQQDTMDRTEDYIEHPLPLLCCTEQGLGGGDYRGVLSNLGLGAWRCDPLSVITSDELKTLSNDSTANISTSVSFNEDSDSEVLQNLFDDDLLTDLDVANANNLTGLYVDLIGKATDSQLERLLERRDELIKDNAFNESEVVKALTPYNFNYFRNIGSSVDLTLLRSLVDKKDMTPETRACINLAMNSLVA